MDIEQIIKAAKAQGWRVDYTTKNHPRFWPPDGSAPETFSGTPSDQRSIRNHLAALRRHGFVWPWSKQAQREWRRKRKEEK
jgi:hypothetical protein